MKSYILLITGILILSVFIMALCFMSHFQKQDKKEISNNKINMSISEINLPQPKYDSGTSIESSLLKRRSVRNYKNSSLSIEELSQLLWSAQGITNEKGGRTTPSAGALYPLELYVVVGNVNTLSKGVYKYNPVNNGLSKTIQEDKQSEIYGAALEQSAIKNAAAIILICGVYKRTAEKYGERAIRYVNMEAGHAAQNIYLQAVSLNVGMVTIGAFEDEKIKKIIKMPEEENPLYIIPVGKI